jgi:hypothetical protein
LLFGAMKANNGKWVSSNWKSVNWLLFSGQVEAATFAAILVPFGPRTCSVNVIQLTSFWLIFN